MTELQELYQDVILDHNRSPRNFGELPNCTHRAEGFNPLCGDHLTLQLLLDGDIISQANFTGNGCAISKASASILTDEIKGKTVDQANEMFNQFHRLVMQEPGEISEETLGKTMIFEGVKDYPARVKCATLAWHALNGALNGQTLSTTE